MNAKLTCLDYGAVPEQISLDVLPLVIGRGIDCQSCLDDRWVSRRHCQIEVCDGVLVIRDLGSKYGTFINGCAVREAPLLPGDTLTIGLSNFVAQYELPARQLTTLSSPEPSSVATSAELQLTGHA